MKIEKQKLPIFEPIVLTITIENQQDLRALFEIGNLKDNYEFHNLIGDEDGCTPESIGKSFSPFFDQLIKEV